jgi:hypothetical protein
MFGEYLDGASGHVYGDVEDASGAGARLRGLDHAACGGALHRYAYVWRELQQEVDHASRRRDVQLGGAFKGRVAEPPRDGASVCLDRHRPAAHG